MKKNKNKKQENKTKLVRRKAYESTSWFCKLKLQLAIWQRMNVCLKNDDIFLCIYFY